MDNIKIEGGRIVFRNFSGKEGKFNPAGNRNFCVLLDSEFAEVLKKDGWNIRYLKPREEGDPEQAYMQVRVMYGAVPPKIVLVNKTGKSVIDEDKVDILDWAEIDSVDMVIRPYEWEVNGKSGIKAYLKTMYVNLAEDEFGEKYENVPDSAQNMDYEPLPFE